MKTLVSTTYYVEDNDTLLVTDHGGVINTIAIHNGAMAGFNIILTTKHMPVLLRAIGYLAKKADAQQLHDIEAAMTDLLKSEIFEPEVEPLEEGEEE